MFNPTIELTEIVEGTVQTVFRHELPQADFKGFPEVVIWREQAYGLLDYEPNIHAVYEKASTYVIKQHPVTS